MGPRKDYVPGCSNIHVYFVTFTRIVSWNISLRCWCHHEIKIVTWHRNLFLFCFVSFALEYLQCGHYQSGLFWLVFITVVSTGHPSNISIFSTNDKYWRIETAHGFWRVCAFFVLVLEKIKIIFIFLIFIRTVRTSVLVNNININTTITLKSMGVHLSCQLFVFQVSYGGSV